MRAHLVAFINTQLVPEPHSGRMDATQHTMLHTEAISEQEAFTSTMLSGGEASVRRAGGRPGFVPESSEACDLYSLFTRIILMVVLVVLGLTGNAVTIRVLWGEKQRSSTIFLLFCLAIADSSVLLWFGCVAIPPAVLRYIDLDIEALNYQNTIRAYILAFGNMVRMVSIWLTVVVTWQRYLSVCRPYQVTKFGSLRTTKLQTLAVLGVAFLFNFPKFFEYRLSTNPRRPGQSVLVGTQLGESAVYQVLYDIVLYYLLF